MKIAVTFSLIAAVAVFVFFITKWKNNMSEISYDLLMIASIIAVLAAVVLWAADAFYLVVFKNRFLMP